MLRLFLGNFFSECIQNAAGNEKTEIVTMLDEILETSSVMVIRSHKPFDAFQAFFPAMERGRPVHLGTENLPQAFNQIVKAV
jgi:hypothetical protein